MSTKPNMQTVLPDRAVHLIGKATDGRPVYAANPTKPWLDYVRVGELTTAYDHDSWTPSMYKRYREFKAEFGISLTK